jgi:1,4-alpha-glucan branching enzyme
MNRVLPLLVIICLVFGCASHHRGPVPIETGVRFMLSAPTATSVAVAGSFNRWDPHQDMLNHSDGRGVWSITLPLAPGRYEYQFFINDETWLLDPAAPEVDDGMGGKNSLLIVGE